MTLSVFYCLNAVVWSLWLFASAHEIYEVFHLHWTTVPTSTVIINDNLPKKFQLSCAFNFSIGKDYTSIGYNIVDSDFNVTWYHNGREIYQHSGCASVYSTDKVTSDLAGDYYCSISSFLGTVNSPVASVEWASLEKVAAPEIQLFSHLNLPQIPLNSIVLLYCKPKNSFLVDKLETRHTWWSGVRWTFNNATLATGIIRDNEKFVLDDGFLVILNFRQEDSGSYRCHCNINGTDSNYNVHLHSGSKLKKNVSQFIMLPNYIYKGTSTNSSLLCPFYPKQKMDSILYDKSGGSAKFTSRPLYFDNNLIVAKVNLHKMGPTVYRCFLQTTEDINPHLDYAILPMDPPKIQVTNYKESFYCSILSFSNPTKYVVRHNGKEIVTKDLGFEDYIPQLNPADIIRQKINYLIQVNHYSPGIIQYEAYNPFGFDQQTIYFGPKMTCNSLNESVVELFFYFLEPKHHFFIVYDSEEIYKNNKFFSIEPSNKENITKKLLTKLKPFTLYRFQLKKLLPDNMKKIIFEVTCRTKESSFKHPPNFTAAQGGNNSIEVHWKNYEKKYMAGVLTGFKLFYKLWNEYKWKTITFPTNTFQYIIKNLALNMKYDVTVLGLSNAGNFTPPLNYAVSINTTEQIFLAEHNLPIFNVTAAGRSKFNVSWISNAMDADYTLFVFARDAGYELVYQNHFSTGIIHNFPVYVGVYNYFVFQLTTRYKSGISRSIYQPAAFVDSHLDNRIFFIFSDIDNDYCAVKMQVSKEIQRVSQVCVYSILNLDTPYECYTSPPILDSKDLHLPVPDGRHAVVFKVKFSLSEHSKLNDSYDQHYNRKHPCIRNKNGSSANGSNVLNMFLGIVLAACCITIIFVIFLIWLWSRGGGMFPFSLRALKHSRAQLINTDVNRFNLIHPPQAVQTPASQSPPPLQCPNGSALLHSSC